MYSIPIILAFIAVVLVVADHYTRKSIKNDPMPHWEPTRPMPKAKVRAYRFRPRRRRNG